MADVQTAVQKWQRNMTASVPTIKAGVMAVRESPMAKAADRADFYLQRVTDAVQSGKFQAALRSVSLADWQQATAEKGTARITAGVNAAVPKMTQFLGQLLPFTENVKRTIATMPKGGTAEADARMLAAVNMMRQFKFQRRAG
jgi:hypothetical protein